MATRKRRPKTYTDPLVYEIGVDISQEEFDTITLAVADWFAEFRVTKEPAVEARQALVECLKGRTKQNRKWFSMAKSSFAARVRSKCRFDIEKMSGIYAGSEKQQRKREGEKKKRRIAKAARDEDSLVPDSIRKELKGAAKYGDNPNIFLSSAEQRNWDSNFDKYMEDYPELKTVNGKLTVQMLCDLHILLERNRMKVLKGERVETDALSSATTQMDKLLKAAGIHPDQLAKRVNKGSETSISAAIAAMEDDEDYKIVRDRHWVEELMQMWMMYMTISADGLGYQLDDIGLFGLTRSRPQVCPKCNTEIFCGIEIEEIEKYLIRRGVLTEVEEGVNATSTEDAEHGNDGNRDPVGDISGEASKDRSGSTANIIVANVSRLSVDAIIGDSNATTRTHNAESDALWSN